MAMDHGWDDSTWQDRAARSERERFDTSRIEHDPDVERRDWLREQERRRHINQSVWDIGVSYYDQRDLYTRNAEIDGAGYGRGPSTHPEEGSYAYPRELHPAPAAAADKPPGRSKVDANIYEREAWPWLNYHTVAEDPFFSKLVKRTHHDDDRAHEHEHEHEHDHDHDHDHESLWHRVKDALGITKPAHSDHVLRSDARLELDVKDALRSRRDLDAADIDVSVKRSVVTLEGTVPNLHTKQVVGKMVEAVHGVREVHNRLKIRKDDSSDANVAFVLPFALGT